MLDAPGRSLRDVLIAAFGGGAETPHSDAAFDDLTRRVFAVAYQGIPAYRAYCDARGRRPGDVASWLDVPAVPTAAFKELPLLVAGASAERVFRTSGTTRGPERRGEHHVADLSLYRSSLRPTFQAFLLPDGASLPFLSLMPPADAMPDSSLAFMIGDVSETFGAPGTAAFADADGLDYAGLEDAVARAEAERRPVLLIGTSASFIHWLDRLSDAGRAFSLSEGSRLMDTGGYKGRGRRVDADQLRAAYRDRLGLDPRACVNEYGMTEMLSQLYDTSLRDRRAASGPRTKRGPWWVRSVAVDPETLEPLPAGRTGLLRHFDLANMGAVPAVQTEDLGRVGPDGVTLEGRVAGAPPRGCSIAMDMLLGAGP